MDLIIFNYIHDFSGQYKLLDLFGVFLAEYLGFLILVAFIILVFLEKNWRQRLYQIFLGFLAMLLARGLIVEVVRFFYESPRPYIALVFKPLIDLELSNSFPSGHASAFFALAVATFIFNKKWGYWFFFGAALIGLARVFVGVHWPSDILGGVVFGALSALIVWKFLPKSH